MMRMSKELLHREDFDLEHILKLKDEEIKDLMEEKIL
jgi:hypothetical protein